MTTTTIDSRHDGYVWDTQREQWRHVDQPDDFDSLWSDERIDSAVDNLTCAGDMVRDTDVKRLLRTMRDEYEIMLGRR